MSALDVQVGGDHYKKYKIQPMEYSMANGLDACQHTAIKYITRFRDKGGIADLEKAKHCIDMLIEFERKDEQIETIDVSSARRPAYGPAWATHTVDADGGTWFVRAVEGSQDCFEALGPSGEREYLFTPHNYRANTLKLIRRVTVTP